MNFFSCREGIRFLFMGLGLIDFLTLAPVFFLDDGSRINFNQLGHLCTGSSPSCPFTRDHDTTTLIRLLRI